MAEDWQNGGFGLYVHWPFCQAKCPYCDFNSHVSRQIDQRVWAEAYDREIDRCGRETEGRVLSSIYFGGGTPSLMQPETVATVIAGARRYWHFANDIEITLEANPGSAEAKRFTGYRDAGVNRLSLGIQALNDADLARLGRIHSADEARAAFALARASFDRVSFDLIYARQGQSLQEWEAELAEALAMAADHLSLYQLTIEPGTAFGDRHARGTLRGLPGEDLAADLFELTQDLCRAHGMPGYEVSNHARPGAESRHNRLYWRAGDYVGIGPGAHGRITLDGWRHATETAAQPGAWLAAVNGGSGESPRVALSPAEQAEEFLLMGLRLREGVDTERYARIAGRELPLGPRKQLSELGLIRDTISNINVTDQGFMVLNRVISELTAA